MDIRNIPTDAITIGPQQIRTIPEDGAFLELCADIAARGLLQPIGVTPIDDTRYQLLWGLRRLTAARHLSWPTIPAHILEAHSTDIRAIALRENIHRSDLSLEDECHTVHLLHTAEGRSIGNIATILNRSIDWVRRRLTIGNLPADLRTAVYAGELAIGAAEAIALVQSPEERDWILKTAREYHWTVDDVRQAVRLALQGTSMNEAIEAALNYRQPEPKPQPEPLYIRCQICHHTTTLETTTLVRACHTCATTISTHTTHQQQPPCPSDST